nr:variable surface lipoprotein [Mycoplasmopsis bovis]
MLAFIFNINSPLLIFIDRFIKHFRLFIALKGEDKFMKKSKFLLLGSVASLASIPFVAS